MIYDEYGMTSLYGNYRTNKFTDIWDSAEKFLADYKDESEDFGNGIPTTISDTNATTLYYLLYGKYGNSHISYSDPTQFKYKLFSLIYMFGPAWEKRLEIQKKIRELTDDEIQKGTQAIYNHSFNPSTAPSTATLDELTTIDSQNTTNYKRSKVDAYANIWGLISTDVTSEFLAKFKDLFLKIVEPQLPLWYITEVDDDEQQTI